MRDGEQARESLLEAIRKKPSGSQNYYAHRTRLSKTTVAWHLRVLTDSNLIAKGTCDCCGAKRWYIKGEI